MVIKLWTMSQIDKLDDCTNGIIIPKAVKDYVIKILGILDDYYDTGRDVDKEDGGYIEIIVNQDKGKMLQQYQKKLQQYHLDIEDMEFEDELCSDELGEWVAHTYFVHMEYGVVIIILKNKY